MLRPDLVLPDSCIEWKTSRSGGPGGQHVNKTETKVDLRFDFEACEVLNNRVKAQIRRLGQGRIGKDGRLRFICGRSRKRLNNKRECEARLRELILRAMQPPPPRRKKTRPTRASKERRLETKKKRGGVKKLRGKVDREN